MLMRRNSIHSLTMKCEDHPTAPAIGRCLNCDKPVCGVCARYQNDNLLCEHCEGIASLQSFVETKSREVARSNVSSLLEEAEQAVEHSRQDYGSHESTTDYKEKTLMGIVILSCVFIGFQIFNSLGSNRPLSAEEIIAEETTRNQIENCMLVFWEIATRFANGDGYDDSLQCPEAGMPMDVATIDGELRVSHPRPDLLGLTDIYVLRGDPTPILVE